MCEDPKNRAETAQEEELDPEIARYATMPAHEVNAELHRLGIDPQKTIDAVTALVNAKLREWHHDARRDHHHGREEGHVTPNPPVVTAVIDGGVSA